MIFTNIGWIVAWLTIAWGIFGIVGIIYFKIKVPTLATGEALGVVHEIFDSVWVIFLGISLGVVEISRSLATSTTALVSTKTDREKP